MNREEIFFCGGIDGDADADNFEIFVDDTVVMWVIFFGFLVDEKVVVVFECFDDLWCAIFGGGFAAVVIPGDVFGEGDAVYVFKSQAEAFEPVGHNVVIVVGFLARTCVGDFAFALAIFCPDCGGAIKLVVNSVWCKV